MIAHGYIKIIHRNERAPARALSFLMEYCIGEGIKKEASHKGKPLETSKAKISAWRTEEHDGRPSDRTFEGNKSESLAAQGGTGLKNNLTSNLTAKSQCHVNICYETALAFLPGIF